LARAFATAEPGSRTLVACRLNDANLRLSIQTTAIDSGGVRRRLIACESLSREIDSAESQAWQRVVRVLAHEMVNSLTPVTSLAETTLTLLDEIRAQEKSSSDPSAWRTEALQDMHDGLATIAKRGRSLMTFVQNYRKVANLPRPDRSWFRIEALFADLAHLYEPSWRPRHIALKTEVIPRHLQLWADRNQVEQALINLLKNAAESIEAQRSTASQDNASSPSNVVSMLASLDHDGSVRIVVRDSGMGFADEALQDIFVPFFTTKAQGSGIGLGLVRQIMLAHDGTVSASNVAGGGASFELRFDPSTNTGTESAMAPASK
jgi:nitrogen fixation/metabolism regulation signal transduction histidine kinase